MPPFTNAYLQEIATLGPFLGIDATTAPYFVDEHHASDSVNVVPDRAYQGYVTAQGRRNLGGTVGAVPQGMIKANDGSDYFLVKTGNNDLRWLRGSTAGTVLALPAGAILTGNVAVFTQGSLWTFMATNGASDTPLKIRYDTKAVTNWGIVAPTTAPTSADGGAGNLNFASYKWVVTYGVQDGTAQHVTLQESSPGPASTALALTNRAAALAAIPVSPDAQVNQRNIYRLDSGGAYRLSGTINDNTTTTATDNTADGNVTGQNLVLHRDPPQNYYALEFHKDSVWGFGWASAISKTQSNIQWSNQTEPWGFNASQQQLPVGENNLNDIAVGLASTSSLLMCFKTHTTWAILGESTADFYAVKLFDIGCISAASITKAQGVTYWLSAQGVYSFDGSAPKYLSARIKSWLEARTATDLSSAAGFYRDRCFFLSFPNQGVTWMYDTTTEEWWKLGWSASLITYDPDTLTNSPGQVISVTAAGAVHQWFAAETDLGLPIVSSYTSRISDSGTPEATKRYRKLVLLAPPQAGATATVTITADPGLIAKSVARLIDLGTGTQAKTVSIPPNIEGREVQVMVQVTSSQQVQIQKIVLYGYSARRLAPTG